MPAALNTAKCLTKHIKKVWRTKKSLHELVELRVSLSTVIFVLRIIFVLVIVHDDIIGFQSFY